MLNIQQVSALVTELKAQNIAQASIKDILVNVQVRLFNEDEEFFHNEMLEYMDQASKERVSILYIKS